MIFNTLSQISATEAKILEAASLADDEKAYLKERIGNIDAEYVEIKKIEADQDILDKLIKTAELDNNRKIEQAAQKVKEERMDLKKLFTDINFLQSLGSAGLSEIIQIAITTEENIIFSDNIDALSDLIKLRNQIRAKERDYFQKLEKIALKEQIRRLKKKEDLLITRRSILSKGKNRDKEKQIRRKLGARR